MVIINYLLFRKKYPLPFDAISTTHIQPFEFQDVFGIIFLRKQQNPTKISFRNFVTNDFPPHIKKQKLNNGLPHPKIVEPEESQVTEVDDMNKTENLDVDNTNEGGYFPLLNETTIYLFG